MAGFLPAGRPKEKYSRQQVVRILLGVKKLFIELSALGSLPPYRLYAYITLYNVYWGCVYLYKFGVCVCVCVYVCM